MAVTRAPPSLGTAKAAPAGGTLSGSFFVTRRAAALWQGRLRPVQETHLQPGEHVPAPGHLPQLRPVAGESGNLRGLLGTGKRVAWVSRGLFVSFTAIVYPH